MIDTSFNKSKRGIYPALLVLNYNNNDGHMYRLPLSLMNTSSRKKRRLSITSR